MEIEEVGDRAEADSVDDIAQRPAEAQTASTMATITEKAASSQRTRSASARNRPKLTPRFQTMVSENGPAIGTEKRDGRS